MKMTWSGRKLKKIVMYWSISFMAIFILKRKIRSVFSDLKLCLNASWGLKGLILYIIRQSVRDLRRAIRIRSLIRTIPKIKGLFLCRQYIKWIFHLDNSPLGLKGTETSTRNKHYNHVNNSHISSLWIWKGVSATLPSGRYTLSYPRRRCMSPVHQLFGARYLRLFQHEKQDIYWQKPRSVNIRGCII